MMKRNLILFVLMGLILLPVTGFSIVYQMKDKNGNYYYLCEGSSGQAMRVKKIGKNAFKVLGPYVGKVVQAENEFKAAQIVCGEEKLERKKSD